MAKCSNCGANVSDRDRVCSYCGAQNPNHHPSPDEVNVLLEKGLAAYQQERYALAIDCYRRAIELDPQVFNAYFHLASSLSALGRDEEAIRAMKEARRIRPGNTAVYYNLALLSKQVGRKRDAQAYLKQALQRVDSDILLQDRRRMKRNIEKALAELK